MRGFIAEKRHRVHDFSTLRPSEFQITRLAPLRYHVYRQAKLSLRKIIVDAGSGDGSIAKEIADRSGNKVLALDLCPAKISNKLVQPVKCTLNKIPINDNSVDAVCFSFVFLWIKNPEIVIKEAGRILKQDGIVMILGEPDLAQRADEPDSGIASYLQKAVLNYGGNPDSGRMLKIWFERNGFSINLGATNKPVEVEDFREIEQEIDFLEKSGTIDKQIANKLRMKEKSFINRRVHLPVTFGTAKKYLSS